MHSSSPPPPPPPPAPPPPPTIVDTSVQTSELRDAARRKRGRAATLLTGQGGLGDQTSPSVATRQLSGTATLLGQ